MTYVYFLTSLNYALKLLVGGLFFNELEPCGNIARDNGHFVLSKIVLPVHLLHQTDYK